MLTGLEDLAECMGSGVELPVELNISISGISLCIQQDKTYCFLNNDSLFLSLFNQRPSFGCIRCERLLAQNVLAGLNRLGCPLVVEAVRRGDVDDIDFWIIKQLLVRATGFGKVVLLGGFGCCGSITRGNAV